MWVLLTYVSTWNGTYSLTKKMLLIIVLQTWNRQTSSMSPRGMWGDDLGLSPQSRSKRTQHRHCMSDTTFQNQRKFHTMQSVTMIRDANIFFDVVLGSTWRFHLGRTGCMCRACAVHWCICVLVMCTPDYDDVVLFPQEESLSTKFWGHTVVLGQNTGPWNWL